MTLEKLRQKLAIEKLVETGVGMVSPATFAEIAKMLMPMQRSDDDSPAMLVHEITVQGIRLIENPFIPDGKIYPFEKWDLRPSRENFPLKEEPL